MSDYVYRLKVDQPTRARTISHAPDGLLVQTGVVDWDYIVSFGPFRLPAPRGEIEVEIERLEEKLRIWLLDEAFQPAMPAALVAPALHRQTISLPWENGSGAYNLAIQCWEQPIDSEFLLTSIVLVGEPVGR